MIHNTNLQFKEKLQLRHQDATQYIILHHSEVLGPHSIEEVHHWHLNKGWAGCGYHFFIRKNGEIYVGRPIDTVGAHTYGHNNESIGVCFEGDFNKEKMGEKQLTASIMLLSLLSLAYDNIPLCPHSQFNKSKNCPGKNFAFERLSNKVEECKNHLRALFGNFNYFDILNLLRNVEENY